MGIAQGECGRYAVQDEEQLLMQAILETMKNPRPCNCDGMECMYCNFYYRNIARAAVNLCRENCKHENYGHSEYSEHGFQCKDCGK